MPLPWRFDLSPEAWGTLLHLARTAPPLVPVVMEFLLGLQRDAEPPGSEVASGEGLLAATVAGCRVVWTDPEVTGYVRVETIIPPA